MRSTLRSFVTLSLLSACNGSDDGAALSRDEAAALVVDELVAAGDPVVVLGMADPLAAGDRIVAYHPLPEMVPEVAIEAESEAWFFWIDDEPGARFDHPSRFAMVDRTTGEITTLDARWWPLYDAAPVWDDTAYDSRKDWVYFELPDGETSRAAFVPDLSPLADCTSSGGSAIVINGAHPGEQGFDDFAKDGANMNDAFTDAGLDTTYFGPTGAENVDQPATYSNLDAYFTEQGAELGPGDTLVVYLNGHGWNNDIIDFNRGQTQIGDVWEGDLERWLSRLDPGVNVVVMIDGCHAGGMLDGLTCVADLAVSATDRDKSSYGDVDNEGESNPQDNGGEWTSSVLTCWGTLMESAESRAGIADRAATAGTNFYTQLVEECFGGAAMYDFAQQRGWSAPQRSLGAPKTAIPQTDPYPPMCAEDEPMSDPQCSAADLEIAAKLLDVILGVEEGTICEDAVEVEEGNEVLHSDGVQTTTAEEEVDLVLRWTASELLVDLPPCGGATICTPEAADPPDTRYTVMALEYESPIVAGGSLYYQYGFVFDSDGDPTNNYGAQEPYPADFYDGTDLWLQLQGGGGSPWQLTLTDVASGYMPVPRAAQVTIDGNTLIVVLPSDLLGDGGGMRFTSFRHVGDYGVSGPWSGDVVPPVGEPLLPLPE